MPTGTIVAPAAGSKFRPKKGAMTCPVWRSTITTLRAAGGTTSPSGWGARVVRVNTRYRPSGVRAGWNSSAAVFTALGTRRVAPVAALTNPMSNPFPGTYFS